MPLKSLIRTIPHYPRQGVMFRDITTLLKDRLGFQQAIDDLTSRYKGRGVQKIVGIESRGFILGGALAYTIGAGFVPMRKRGKLPAETIGHDYELEYGADRLELHRDAIDTGERVLIVDDLVATGGTAEAAVKLTQQLEADLLECCFLIELSELPGRNRLEATGCNVHSLAVY